MVLSERKIESIESFLARFPEVKTVILNVTERPVQRPQDDEKQKAHYLGEAETAYPQTHHGDNARQAGHFSDSS